MPESSIPFDAIKHIVVLMFENRSFDNLVAWLYNDRDDVPERFIPPQPGAVYQGLTDKTLSRYVNFLIHGTKGVVQVVFKTPPIKGVPSVSASRYLNSPPIDPYETFENVTRQLYGRGTTSPPSMDGFLQNYAHHWEQKHWASNRAAIEAVMETYTAQQLPNLNGIVRHYAISDQWFSSVPTQTNPNRAFMACGTSLGQCDNGKEGYSYFPTDTVWHRIENALRVSRDGLPPNTWTIFWEEPYLPDTAQTKCFTEQLGLSCGHRSLKGDRHRRMVDHRKACYLTLRHPTLSRFYDSCPKIHCGGSWRFAITG